MESECRVTYSKSCFMKLNVVRSMTFLNMPSPPILTVFKNKTTTVASSSVLEHISF